jgi:hypothetical protein
MTDDLVPLSTLSGKYEIEPRKPGGPDVGSGVEAASAVVGSFDAIPDLERDAPEVPVAEPIRRDIVGEPSPNRSPNSDLDSLDLERESVNPLEESFKAAQDIDPVKAADILSLARQYGEPPEVIAANYDQAKKNSINPDPHLLKNVQEKMAGTAAWLTDPKNMAIARDDVQTVSKFEEWVKEHSFANAIKNYLHHGILSFEKGVREFPAYMEQVGIEEEKRDPLRYWRPGFDPNEKPAIRKDWFETPEVQAIKKRQDELFVPRLKTDLWESAKTNIKSGNYSEFSKDFAAHLMANAPTNLSILFFSALRQPNIGLGLAGATSASQSFSKSIEKGVDPSKAVTAATVRGAAEVGFEKIGTVSVLERLAESVYKAYGKQTFKAVFTDVGKTLFGEGAKEALTEQLTEFTGMLGDVASGADPNSFDGFIGKMFAAGALGFGSTMTMTGPTAALVGRHRLMLADKAKADAEFMTQLIEQGKEMKISQTAPREQHELFKQVVEANGMEDVRIDAKTLDVLFQADQPALNKFLADLNLLEQFDRAKEANNDLVIPAAAYVSMAIQGGYHNKLKNDIRLNTHSLSINETKAEDVKMQAEADAVRSQILQEQSQQVQAIKQQILERFKNAGVTGPEAQASAQLAAENIVVTSSRRGLRTTQQQLDESATIQEVDGAPEGALEQDGDGPVDVAKDGEIGRPLTELPQDIAVTERTEHKRVVIGKKSRSAANELAPRGQFQNDDLGIVVTVNAEGVREAAHYGDTKVGSKSKTAREEHIEAMQYLDDLIKNAVQLSSKAETKGRDTENWLYLFAPLRMNGKDYWAKLQVKKEGDSYTYYNHVVVRDEGGAGKAAASQEASALPATRMGIADFTRKIKGVRQANKFFQKTNLPAIQPTVSPLGLYSEVERQVLAMDFGSAPAGDIWNRIKNLPGIKPEELEWLHLEEFLTATAEQKGQSLGWRVVGKSGEVLAFEPGIWDSKEYAEQVMARWQESPAHQGMEFKVEEVIGTGKVTKDQLLNLIRANEALQLEQTVRAASFKAETSGRPGAADLSWDEGEVMEPDSDSVWEDARYGDLEALESIKEYIAKDEKEYQEEYEEAWLDLYTKVIEESDSRIVMVKRQSDGAEVIDVEATKKALSESTAVDDIDKLILKRFQDGSHTFSGRAYERAMEWAMDPMNDMAEWRYTERETGWELTGSDERGWYSPEARHNFENVNLEEAKVQLIPFMIEQRALDGDLLIPEEDVEILSPKTMASTQAVEEEAKKLLNNRKEKKRITARAEAYYDDWWREHYSKKEIKEKVADKVQEYAKEEAAAILSDPSNPENEVSVTIKVGPVREYTIQGSQSTGWHLKGAGNMDLGGDGSTLDAAKEAAINHLKAEKVIDPGTPKLEPGAEIPEGYDVNRPTGPALHLGSRVVPGGKNHREFLIRLPNISGSFRVQGHFPEDKIVVFIRVSERTDANGKRVLFIEEIQSDWHQEGREKGYQGDKTSEDRTNFPDGFKVEAQENGTAYTLIVPDEYGGGNPGGWATVGSAIKRAWEIVDAERRSSQVPNAPFKNTEAYTGLALKRMLHLAMQEGFDGIALSPAIVHVDRWGTDNVTWAKKEGGFFEIRDRNGDLLPESESYERKALQFESEKKANQFLSGLASGGNKKAYEGYTVHEVKDHWLVGSSEQRGGNVDGMNLEEVARQRGMLLEKRGTRVTSKEELKTAIIGTIGGRDTDRNIESITDAIWKQMESGDPTGVKEPRREGQEFIYDTLVPKVLRNILKKLDKNAKLEVGAVPVTLQYAQRIKEDDRNAIQGDDHLKALELQLTPELKAAIQKGLPLFQDDSIIRGYFDPMKKVIGLLKGKANITTIVHELSHSWFQEMGRDYAELKALSQTALGDASMTDTQTRFLQDAEAILQWLGAKSFESVTTEQQEKFARAWEAYVAEGKAPSLSLKRAFDQFKIWFTNLGRTLLNLNVEMTPEVRDIFARMVATDEQIQQAKEVLNQRDFTPGDFGIVGKDAERVLLAQSDAENEAKRQIEQRLIDDMKKKQRKEYKERRKSVREEMVREVGQEPVYMALFAMRKGTLPDGTPLEGGEPAPKIDRQSLKESFPAGTVAKIPRGVFGKDGLHYDMAAMHYGFRSGSEFVVQLAAAEDFDTLVDRLTDERMNTEYGDLLTDPKLSEEAKAALHSDKRAQLLRLQLEIMAAQHETELKKGIRMLGRRVPTAKQVREFAETQIRGMVLADIKPHEFEKAEARAAKRASDLFAAGDILSAFEAKRSEYYNHELYRAALAALEKKEAAEESYKRIFRRNEDLAKTRDMDLVLAARAVLSYFGMGRGEKSPMEHLAPLQQYDPETHAHMVTLVNTAIAGAQPFEDITYGKFLDVDLAVKSLWHIAKSGMEIQMEERKLSMQQATDMIREDIQAISKPKEKDKYNRTKTAWEKTKMGLLGVWSGLRRAESWADSVGENTKALITRPIHDAATQYRLAREKNFRRLQEIIKPIEKTLDTAEIEAPELDFVFQGRAQLIGMLLHLGNTSNKSKLVNGRKWGEVDVETQTVDTSRLDSFIRRMEAEGKITKADWDVVQGIWDLLEELKPDAQKAHRAMYGYHFGEVTAEPVQTSFGEYRGGYFPAVADPLERTEANVRGEQNQLDQMTNAVMFPTGGRGFTKARVEAYAQPLIMDLRASLTPVDKVLKFTHLEPAVKQVGRVVWNKEVRAILEEFDPNIVPAVLIPFLQKAANQRVDSPVTGFLAPLNRIFGELRKRAGMQIMAFHIANGMQQVTGIEIAAAKVDRKYLYPALIRYMGSPSETAEMIREKSDFMKTRTGNQVFEVTRQIEDMILNPSKYRKFAEWSQDKAYIFQQVFQNMVDNTVWNGAYAQAVAQGFDEKAAVIQADEAVRLTQGSFNAEDVSAAEGGNNFVRMFTQFFSFFNMQYNLMLTESEKASRLESPGERSSKRLWLYASFMSSAVLASLLMKLASGRLDDDDDGEYADDLFRLLFSAPLDTAVAMVPGVGRGAKIMAESAWSAITDEKPRYGSDRIQTPAGIAAIESFAKSPKEFAALVKGELTRRQAKDMLTVIGILTGLPVGAAARPIGYTLDMNQGKAQPDNVLDLARGMTTGYSGAPR